MPNLTVSANIDTFMGSADNATARTNLSAAKSGANTDLTSVALTTGTITTAPGSANDIVNKSYADSIGSGVNFHDACDYGTIAVLSPAATYNQPGGAGVGVNATLTGGTNAPLNVDGYTVEVGKRILVKNQTSTFQNGIYNVTRQGDGATVPYILTRASDYDTSGSGINEVQAGDFVIVLNQTLANTAWVQQTPAPINFGVTSIVFIQFAAANAGVTSFNTSLSGLTPSTNSTGAVTLAGTLAASSGGTGQSTFTDGQLLIGNTATGGLTKATLTAGTNVTITNGNGSISIAASGGTATPTDVQTFTSSGTWTKPTGAKAVEVQIVGGGGGGGSGRKGATSTVRSGGGGGGGAGTTITQIDASTLGATVAVVIGAGGLGGASQATNSTNGVIGVDGGDSTFGIFRGRGGSGGNGGTTTTATGGIAGAGQFSGGAGGTGGGSSVSLNAVSATLISGGGGGGGVNATNTNVIASNGGFISSTNQGAAGGGASPLSPVPHGLITALGQGGGGGNASQIGNGVSGAAGGLYGGGGGGGGAATDGVGNSGAGGDGIAGIVIVTTYF